MLNFDSLLSFVILFLVNWILLGHNLQWFSWLVFVGFDSTIVVKFVSILLWFSSSATKHNFIIGVVQGWMARDNNIGWDERKRELCISGEGKMHFHFCLTNTIVSTILLYFFISLISF
jgi:hypothetical protein